MSLTMFVDPGLGGTGAAVFNDMVKGVLNPPIWYDRIIIDPKSATWMERSIQTSIWIRSLTLCFSNKKVPWSGVFVEFPEVWSGSLKSNTAVRGGKHGNAPLLKLASLAGMITCSFLMSIKSTNSSRVIKTEYIKPAQWKGQLPKDQVIRRIRHDYNWGDEIVIRDHEADAVGMGLAFQKGGKV